MDPSETTAAVQAILPKKSIFDPADEAPTSSAPKYIARPLNFGPDLSESSDEETRDYIRRTDPKLSTGSSTSGTPKIRLTPRVKNAPRCTYELKRGAKKGEACGKYCRLGEDLCSTHNQAARPKASYDLEPFAEGTKFERLKVSKKYKLLQQTKEPRMVIFLDEHKIIKVRLPKFMMPIPKTGSYLMFKKNVPKTEGRKATPMWESD